MTNKTNNNELSDDILTRRNDLADGLKMSLKRIPVDVFVENADVKILFLGSLVCGVEVMPEAYKVYGISSEWVDCTHVLCQKDKDETWHSFMDSIDDCIGEITRFVEFEAKKGTGKTDISFEYQYGNSGLDIISNWGEGVRERFKKMFSPILENTEYRIDFNQTESQKGTLDFFGPNRRGRLMGITPKKKDMEIQVFLNMDFYEKVKHVIIGSKERKPGKSQKYLSVTMKSLWNIMCVATGKVNLMTKE